MKMTLTLLGHDIYLRALTLNDASDDYCLWLNDSEVTKHLEVRYYEQTKETIKDFIQSKIVANNEYLFAICDNITNKHIGNIKLGPIDIHHKRADISLFIGDKSYWGKGLATQAIKTLTHFAFTELTLNKLMASCYQGNNSSVKTFVRAGFNVEGKSPEYLLLDGKPHDLIWMGLSIRQYNEK
jgi:RimJ/RimL family protein N-acetyltransferase